MARFLTAIADADEHRARWLRDLAAVTVRPPMPPLPASVDRMTPDWVDACYRAMTPETLSAMAAAADAAARANRARAALLNQRKAQP